MPRPQSISLEEFTKAVDSAVEQAARKHEAFRDIRHKDGIVHDHWIVGFFLRDQRQLSQATLGDAREFAADVASHLGSVGGLSGTGPGTAVILDRGLICGFVPQRPLTVRWG